MKRHSDRRRTQEYRSERRRVHDVVIWQEETDHGSYTEAEWVVYDQVTDSVRHFDNELEALAYFKELKSQNQDRKLV